MKNRPPAIYLDTAATTPMLPEVIEAMRGYLGLEGCFANPSSGHSWGREAAEAIEAARRLVARELGCESEEVLFTSGATEANTLALHGTARAYASHGKHIITTAMFSLEELCIRPLTLSLLK